MSDAIAEVDRHRREQHAYLSTLSSLVVTGLMFPSGAGASHTPGDAQWTLSFTCAGWRIGDGPLQRNKLSVRQLVDEGAVRPFMERYPVGSILVMRAKVDETTFGHALALLDDVVAVDPADPELLKLLEELRAPVTHTDDVLGTLTLDRRFDWYAGRVGWGGVTVALYALAHAPGDLEKSLLVARRLWSEWPHWADQVRQMAVKELVALKNDAWLDDGEAAVSAEAFAARMALNSVMVGPDGVFEFGHSDGDLFWGHDIEVCGSLQNGVQRAGIVG